MKYLKYALLVGLGVVTWEACTQLQCTADGASSVFCANYSPSAGSPVSTVTIQPTPTPSPSPSPSGTPTAPLCVLPASTQTTCTTAVSAHAMEAAIAEIQAKIPQADKNNIPIVYTESVYVKTLAVALVNAGFCVAAGVPVSDEISIKNSNSFSETYDVWNASGFPQLLYINTCTPARF